MRLTSRHGCFHREKGTLFACNHVGVYLTSESDHSKPSYDVSPIFFSLESIHPLKITCIEPHLICFNPPPPPPVSSDPFPAEKIEGKPLLRQIYCSPLWVFKISPCDDVNISSSKACHVICLEPDHGDMLFYLISSLPVPDVCVWGGGKDIMENVSKVKENREKHERRMALWR